MKTLVVACALFATVAAAASAPEPIVGVAGGRIRGVVLANGGAVFKGIPYAGAPIGDLRWREPMPVPPWTGVRDATTFGAMCRQNPNGLMPNAEQITSEDCLFLNVWTTEWPIRSRRPVLVKIPGGGNIAGGASLPVFDGETLSARGVVVVTLNYRLGLFGFFSHPALTRESPYHASGNQGLLDQIAALRWVRENIARFGGDRNNVTVSGESGGGWDLSALMTAPLANGLFQRVIIESGAIVTPNVGMPLGFGDPLTAMQAETYGSDLSSRWSIPDAASARDLRAVPAVVILKSQSPAPRPATGISVDGQLLPRPPAEVFLAGGEHKVPLLIGSNIHERAPGAPIPPDLNAAIRNVYGPISERASALYVDDPIYGTATNQWATDTQFRCPAITQALWHAAAGNATFEYEFARLTPGRETLGVTHGSQIAYTFGTIDRAGVVGGPAAKPNDIDQHVSDVMQQYWVNFARTGNPNGHGVPRWPPFDSTARRYMQFTDAGPVTKEALRRPFCDLFVENARRTLAH